MVSRQFRVLETVGSSPAASTIKTVFDGLFLFCRSRQGREPTSRIFTMLALGSLLIFVRILPARELGIAARGLLHFNCSAFYIRILTSARRARYRTRRYAAFSAQSASSSLVSGKRENIHFWWKSRFSFPLLIVSRLRDFLKIIQTVVLAFHDGLSLCLRL